MKLEVKGNNDVGWLIDLCRDFIERVGGFNKWFCFFFSSEKSVLFVGLVQQFSDAAHFVCVEYFYLPSLYLFFTISRYFWKSAHNCAGGKKANNK